MKAYIAILFIFLLFAAGCIGGSQSNQNTQSVPYFSVSVQKPLEIDVGKPFAIMVDVETNEENIQWTFCLNSFQSSFYTVTGDQCVNSNMISPTVEGNSLVYKFGLPYDGTITLSSPYIPATTADVSLLGCFKYRSVFELNGDLNTNQPESLSFYTVSSQSPFYITNAYVFYDTTDQEYILVVDIGYTNILSNFTLYGFNNKDFEECSLSSIPSENVVNYTLVVITNKLIEIQNITSFSILSNNFEIRIPIPYSESHPGTLMRLYLDYYVIATYDAGEININT